MSRRTVLWDRRIRQGGSLDAVLPREAHGTRPMRPDRLRALKKRLGIKNEG